MPVTARLEHAIDQHRLPGLAVVVRRGNEDVFRGGVGSFDAAGQRTITDQTQFGVASLTKLVTTIMMLLLHQRGALSIDDSVSKYFPSLRIAQQMPMTLANLLSHSAGFPGLPGRFYARNINDVSDRSGGIGQRGIDADDALPDLPTVLNASELVDLLNQLQFNLFLPAGDLLNYSNEGFCLLGGVIEQVTQRPYVELAGEMVFAPLQMTNSYVGSSNRENPSGTALPLVRDGDAYRTASFWQAPLFYPAGGCISSAGDIARLIGALAQSATLLSEESKQRISQPGMPVASRPVPGIGYGLGVEVQRVDSATTMLWHSGQRAGISSYMALLVKEEMAISVLCNVADAPVTTIAHELIGDILNRSDINWPPATLAGSADANGADKFVGRYASAEGNYFDIKKDGDSLVVYTPSAPTAQRLLFSGPDNGTMGPHTFRFLCDAPRSNASAFAIDLRVLRRTD